MKTHIFFTIFLTLFIIQTSEAQWQLNGNHLFNINPGNIGIGTNTPTSRLTVTGGTATSPLVQFTASTLGQPVLALTLPAATMGAAAGSRFLTCTRDGNTRAYINNMGGAYFGSSVAVDGNLRLTGSEASSATGSLQIQSGQETLQADGNEINTSHTLHLNNINSSDVALTTGGGDVGIGTSAPTAKLHLKGDLKIESPNNNTFQMATGNDGALRFIGDNNVVMTLNDDNARVGIGTITPDTKLHLVDNDRTTILAEATGAGANVRTFLSAQKDDGVNTGRVGTSSDHPMRFYTNNESRMIITESGKVGIGIGVVPNGYILGVDGKVICEELKVQLSGGWPDYVFKPEYHLPGLLDVAKSIEQTGHLPGIPSASEVEKAGGIEVGEMQRLMLEKIEELTLYMIGLKKENDELKVEINALKNK